jgi:hypothetical protein
MKVHTRSVFVLSCFLAARAFAQDPPPKTDQTEASPVGNCAGRQDLAQHKIRSARVSDPFWFLRWRKLDETTLAAVQALKDKPYSFDTVNAVSKMIEAKAWLPDTPDARAEFSYSDIAVENCQEQQLDVVFHVFSARISSPLSSIAEWRTKQVEAPHEAAGVAKADAPVQFAPEAGFDPGRGFFAGGTTRMTFAPGSLFRSVELRGAGSSESRFMSATLNGAYDSSTAWLSHAEWRLDFSNSIMPAAVASELGQSRLAGQFSGMSRPHNGVVFRFGGMMEGGTDQSAFAATQLSAGTLANSHYTSAKLYSGVTGNWQKQAFAASFGLGLGSTGDSFHGGWRKLVGDVSHQLWLPAGNYRLLEVEQRFTAGGIQNLGSIPVAERFFGGNHETPFIAGSDWAFRSNPVIRSIPANRLYQTAAGVGGDQFFSYNSTTAFTVWSKPVVPKELVTDAQFKKLLKGAMVSQTSVVENYYKSKDSHFQTILNSMPQVAVKLEQIRAAKDAAHTSAPPSLQHDFDVCTDAIDSSADAVKHAINDKLAGAFGWVPELLPDGIDPLSDVVSICGKDLVAKLAGVSIPAPILESSSKDLDGMSTMIATNLQAIDEPLAKKKATEDLSYVQRTLDVITKQMTITSISPVFVFDVARIGPAATGIYSGNRYGVGGGIRLTLVSTVSFTAGYAVNRNPRPGEGKGAFFFSLTTRNLFE